MNDRLKSLLLILIFVFLVSGLALAVLSQIQAYYGQQVYLATQSALPIHKDKSPLAEKQYFNPVFGIAFQYPTYLTLSETASSVELSHKIPFKNYGECDMKGDSIIYDELTDFRVKLQILEGSVAQAVKKISPYMPKENFSGNTIKISPGFIDEYSAGQLKGFAIYEGVEGCGHTIYYFPLGNNRVLVVENAMIQQLSGIVSSDLEKQILAVPGAISRQKNSEILVKFFESITPN